jgi:hypothetical protein
MNSPERIKIDLDPQTRATTWRWQLEVLDNDQPFDFTGKVVKWAIRPATGGANVIELETGAGITESAGVLTFEVDADDTAIAAGTYAYDLRFENADTFVYVGGSLRVIDNVTLP